MKKIVAIAIAAIIIIAPVFAGYGAASAFSAPKLVPATTNLELHQADLKTLVPPKGEQTGKSAMEVAIEQAQARKAQEEAQKQAEQNAASQASSGGAAQEERAANYSEQDEANAILASIIAQYPILAGTVVYIRETPNGWEGCAYYKSGVILVSPYHTYPLYDIIWHEAMHILDWREDNDIDNNDAR